MKRKKSHSKKLHFFSQFSSLVPTNSQSGWNGSTCEDARWGLASMSMTSLMTWNCLKYPLLKTYAKKSSLYLLLSIIFDG